MRNKRDRHSRTLEELEALWRPHPDFIGPVGPPMLLFSRDRAAQEEWEIAVNLRPRPLDDGPADDAPCAT
jgi:hypothetical protein